MGLETGNYITDLVPTNPTGTDSVSDGDSHLRLIKDVLLKTFPAGSVADPYVPKTGGAMTGNLDMGSNYLLNVKESLAPADGATVGQVNARVSKAGDTMTGALDITNNGTTTPAFTCAGWARVGGGGADALLDVFTDGTTTPGMSLSTGTTRRGFWQYPTDTLMRFGTDQAGDWYLAHASLNVAVVTSAGVSNVSDARTKQNIRPAGVGLAEIVKLTPALYERGEATELGLIAQDIEAAGIQHAVIETPHTWPGESEEGSIKSVNSNALVAALVAAVKELDAKVKALENAP